MTRTMSLVLGAALAFAAGAASAQDLTVEEIQQLFEKQKQAFSEAESSGLGQTRGLKLVTLEDMTENEVSAAPDGGSASAAAGASVSAPSDPNEPLVVGQLDSDLQINLQIKFDYDSAALSSAEKPKLARMCQALQASDVQLVRIVGHTDAAGSDEYNERLSRLRAEEVARHLVEECGIAPDRLQTMGMGERFPVNADNPRADENRRVEFQALS